ncbi:glycine--tRNA ligase subunit beta [Acidiphilium acidophilum]|uniref:Glycine--tRNA ligase beta subunit n=1 Tax=Acidiphilium acidophilum TaxID=76588 RepID=A0AAW9DTD6_ACIAO|nr:glycine--tRNA ligase subunit beta [Acidiphilium acidophilum]MDX5931608.1 glycine--tRNA ligase subunit beta [Acidiphilium acidophilum]
MAEFFLELFSEEIPARMQAQAADHLAKIAGQALAPLQPHDIVTFHGPRRIALGATMSPETPSGETELRGPKRGAPAQALEGFLRKNNADRADLVEEGEHVLLRRTIAARPAADVILTDLARALAAFPWPKSMRWGQSGGFTWVRPLRRIVCLLDGEIVPIVLGPVTASNLSEGHRFLVPGAFEVSDAAQWHAELTRRCVVADAGKRRAMIAMRLDHEAQARGLAIVRDDALLDEVTGLVEYPVPMIGSIEQRFMTLPPEVRELSMKVNQRYFATRDATGAPAPHFAFIANITASDRGATIIAGNERVLRARLADAEHFWTQDRQHKLEDYLPKLKSVVFHAKLGTQFERAERIARLAREIAQQLGADSQSIDDAERAGLLCKADLVTGMVGEFPELQGIMGGYYAGGAVGAAIRTHYQPKGPSDDVPQGIVPCAVALADKLDTLREFFRIGETPTGSGDPYALRRAALGVVRIILENDLQLHLRSLLDDAVFDFIIERFRVKLRGEGKRFDVVNAILANTADDDLFRVQQCGDALESFIKTDDGANLLVAYRRGVNILRIENEKDGPHTGEVDESALVEGAEINLAIATHTLEARLSHAPHLDGPGVLDQRNFDVALKGLASLRSPVDAFFNDVTVNAEDPALRRNRLRLLAKLRDVMHRVADFSKLEG